MKKIILFFVALSAIGFSNAQGVITVQRGASTIFESSLDSAVVHAQHGDVIYLSSGNYQIVAQINKKVSIIGTGYHPDSSSATGITAISGQIVFAAGSDSSLITGVLSTLSLSINSNSVFVSRCYLKTLLLASNSNIRIQECIIDFTIDGNGSFQLNSTISNCIIFGALANFLNGMTISNNIFLRGDAGPALSGVSNSIITNNIFFKNNPFYGSVFLVVNNNLFQADNSVITGVGVVANSNLFNETSAFMFVNFPGGVSQWASSYDFHLKPGCSGIGAGIGGTDVGIYGGNTPWKEGGKPFNPHFQRLNISNGTGTNGLLNIDIKVEAQDR